MKKVVTFCLAMLLAGSMWGQTQETKPGPRDSQDQTQMAAQLKALAEQLKAQQEQIQRLQEQLRQRDQQWQQMQQQLQQAQSNVAHAPNLGVIASTSPVLPSAPAKEAPLAAGLSTQEPPAKAADKAAQASDSIVLKGGKIKIGAVAYAQWSAYYQTGFGPAFLDTPNNYPGPGNDGYNSFDVTRTYVNFLFSPTDWVTFRITPDIFRNIGSPSADALSGTSGTNSTPDGSLALRLKYAYAEFTKMFGGAFKEDNVRFGQQVNPLVDWEEALYGYRFTNLVPWNFTSLSSTYTGISLNGPIKKNGKQYVDYQIGVFNNSNFHQFELSETKTVMGRVSVYPMGASSRFQGLGLTGFADYGYSNAAPEVAAKTPVVRTAALIHYQSAHNGGQIAFEYDFGRNAFSTGNMFGGSEPKDLLTPATVTSFAGMSSLAKSILAGRRTKQQGFAVFGHINIPNSKYAVFGTYQFWQPNTNVRQDPLDFHRLVAGISYTLNKNVGLALDSQNVLYRHRQFTYPAADIALFDPALAATNPGGIANAVPKSVKAIFANMEFTF
jgi:hypothetical protein